MLPGSLTPVFALENLEIGCCRFHVFDMSINGTSSVLPRCGKSSRCILSPIMAAWTPYCSCPRADSCISCRSAVSIPGKFIEGVMPCPDCWYMHVALWMMRSVPFIQLRKTFKVPDILVFEVACYLV